MIITLIFLAILFATVIIVAAIVPVRSTSSDFEISRRLELGDEYSKLAAKREELATYVLSIRNLLVSVILVIFSIISVSQLGLLWGVVLALLVAIFYGPISRLQIFRKLARKLYKLIEASLLDYIGQSTSYLNTIRSVNNRDISYDKTIGSREELVRLVSETTSVLTPSEKRLLISGLEFEAKLVKDVMTPKSEIVSIAKNEFLGPITLDDIHKRGHGRLPVTNGDIDHIVGILNIKDLLSLEDKKSTTAGKAMDDKVYYIKEDQSLAHALAAFLKTGEPLFIVINSQRETRGLITLEDVVEALIGRKIKDEFESHHNINVVSRRQIEPYNQPPKSRDV